MIYHWEKVIEKRKWRHHKGGRVATKERTTKGGKRTTQR